MEFTELIKIYSSRGLNDDVKHICKNMAELMMSGIIGKRLNLYISVI